MPLNDFQLSTNFNLQEFQCKHCGKAKVGSRLVSLLQTLRDTLGKPVTITSGYRCEEHNKAVGGSRASYHMLGMAVDIAVAPTGLAIEDLANLCISIGFKGIGINPNNKTFLHVDVRNTEFPVRFSY